MKKLLNLWILVLVVLSACSGNNAGSAKTAPPSVLERLESGSEIVWKFSGFTDGSKFSYQAKADYREAQDKNGEPCIEKTVNMFSAEDGKPISMTLVSHLRQDEAGSLYDLGDESEGWILEPALVVRSPLKIDDTFNADRSFESGNTQKSRAKIIGLEEVAVPMGTFLAFKVEVFEEDSKGQEKHGYEWWVPPLAQPIKLVAKFGSTELLYEMVKYTRPKP